MKYVRTLLYGASVLLLFFLPLACQSDKPEEVNGPFDPDARIESSLGDISLTSEQVDTRAATYKPLGDGETFRLYALKHGVTDMQQIVTSYTYTMKGGKPVMDSGQGDGKLYLPYGDLDIYLVGPVSVPSEETDADGNPVMVSVAAPTGVIPRQGVDLIASCTPVTISYTGANKVNPVPLKHKMAKVRVRVNRNSDKYILMKYLKLTKVELYNQYSGVGMYTFGADGGVITPLAPDSVAGMSVIAEGSKIKQMVENKEYYADFMLLPRQAGYQKIEVEMDITLTNNEENPYRMSGITRNIEFIGGKQNMLFTEPEVSNDIVWRPALLPWDEEEPVATPMGGDVVVYLDGRDAPEMINGKLCWRDRSGNGNHAEIPASSGITYNAERMCYEFATKNKFMVLPALGYIPNYTLEIMVENMGLVDASLLNFRSIADERDLTIHVPSTNNRVYFDSGVFRGAIYGSTTDGRISELISQDPIYYGTFRTYFFRKESQNPTKMALGVDGVTKFSQTKATQIDHKAFDINEIGGLENIKIRSVRLYRKALTDTELKKNYQADNSFYRQDPDIVQEGLILSLDGKTPPYISTGKGSGDYLRPAGAMYWPDTSGQGHHAEFKHVKVGKNFIHHNGNGYEFNNVNEQERSYMELLGSLGTNQNFTFEIVFKAKEKSEITPFYSTANATGSVDQARALNIHMPWAGAIYFDCPYGVSGFDGNRDRLTYKGPVSTFDYLSGFHYHAFQREKDGVSVGRAATRYYSDGVLVSSYGTSVANVEMRRSVIGHGVLYSSNIPITDWLRGEILTIRLYNRVLTATEILKNSRADRARYKY